MCVSSVYRLHSADYVRRILVNSWNRRAFVRVRVRITSCSYIYVFLLLLYLI